MVKLVFFAPDERSKRDRPRIHLSSVDEVGQTDSICQPCFCSDTYKGTRAASDRKLNPVLLPLRGPLLL